MSKLQANQLEDTVLSDSDIGVSVQAHSANLDEFAAINPTAAGLALLDDADAATQRTTLGLGTLDSPQFAGINLGHASDTPLTRASAGQLAVDGVTVATASNTLTMSGKTLTSPTINTPTIEGGTAGVITPLTRLMVDSIDLNGGSIIVTDATPLLRLVESDQATDNKSWQFSCSGTELFIFALDDAGSASGDTIRIGRSGNAVTRFRVGPASSSWLDVQSSGVTVGGNSVSTNSTSSTHTVQQIELGHASDTTITRPAAGRVQIEGREIITAAADATQLTSSILELNKNDDSAAAISGYVSGMRTYIHEDGAYTAAYSIDSTVTEGTFESFGPTGSGATNIWSALNSLPSNATIATIGIYVSLSPNTGAKATSTVYARKTGSGATLDNFTAILMHDVEGANKNGFAVVDVPLDESQRFDLTWQAGGDASRTITIYLKGFKV